MHNIFIVLFLLITVNYAKDIKPVATLQTSGLVSDFVEDDGLLYVATDAGVVDIIDLFSQQIVSQITFEPLQTLMGDTVPVRINSIDRYKGKTLLVTSGISAYRNVWIHDGNTLNKIIDEKKHLMTKHAFFTDKGKIILGTFGSEVVLYDNNENYKVYSSQVSESTMGGMALSSDKKKMVVSDESGTVRLIDVNSSKVEKTLSSEHVDNVYAVAYSKDVILTAGQDRRIGIYTGNDAFHLKSDFLVYCVGISPSAQIGIYSSGIKHDLQVFTTKNGKKTDRLVGHHATPTKIMFTTENTLITAGDEYTIYFWVLKQNTPIKLAL